APTRADQQGGIIDKAMPIDASNVAVISPKDGKATRVGYKVLDDGSKIRVCKRTGEEIK
ncbi:MAG: 50S ribosomal protein L24, partial [Acidimicrobiales bacterium]|nr:50S ribosomal protein L24 [Acidimicrobiales bacterium]